MLEVHSCEFTLVTHTHTSNAVMVHVTLEKKNPYFVFSLLNVLKLLFFLCQRWNCESF